MCVCVCVSVCVCRRTRDLWQSSKSFCIGLRAEPWSLAGNMCNCHRKTPGSWASAGAPQVGKNIRGCATEANRTGWGGTGRDVDGLGRDGKRACVTCGVPQGSTLSPFASCSNASLHSVVCYADDTRVSVHTVNRCSSSLTPPEQVPTSTTITPTERRQREAAT